MKPKIFKNSEKYLYSLNEAALRFNLPEEYFLTLATDNLITLMIRVPIKTEICASNRIGQKYPLNLLTDLQFLKLDRITCSSLKMDEHTDLRTFPEGYRLGIENTLESISPYDAWDKFDKLLNEEKFSSEYSGKFFTASEFAVVSDDSATPQRVSRKDVLIHRSELLRQQDLAYEAPHYDGTSLYSSQLTLMIEASVRFWRRPGIDALDRSTHPADDVIKAWFKTNGFTETLASKAVSIITPDDVNKKGAPIKTKAKQKIPY